MYNLFTSKPYVHTSAGELCVFTLMRLTASCACIIRMLLDGVFSDNS